MLATVMTNVTASPMPILESSFLDTPKNGQMPTDWLKIMLLVKMPATTMVMIPAAVMLSPPYTERVWRAFLYTGSCPR